MCRTVQLHTRAFVDETRNFEPWLSDEDNTYNLVSPLLTNRRTFQLSTDLTCIASLHGGSLVVLGSNLRQGKLRSDTHTTRLPRPVFNDTGLELMTRQLQVRNLHH
ncbi:hypothetical protein TNCV_2047801 [Trichonephila clavipes]|nr:hypothetical protein TNCV_2047801 [Trichonephila clavipes]